MPLRGANTPPTFPAIALSSNTRHQDAIEEDDADLRRDGAWAQCGEQLRDGDCDELPRSTRFGDDLPSRSRPPTTRPPTTPTDDGQPLRIRPGFTLDLPGSTAPAPRLPDVRLPASSPALSAVSAREAWLVGLPRLALPDVLLSRTDQRSGMRVALSLIHPSSPAGPDQTRPSSLSLPLSSTRMVVDGRVRFRTACPLVHHLGSLPP